MTSILFYYFYFFLYILLEEKTFSSRLEICFQMSAKVSQNAPKVVRRIKNFLGGTCPRTPLAYARHARFIVLVMVIPLFFALAVLISVSIIEAWVVGISKSFEWATSWWGYCSSWEEIGSVWNRNFLFSTVVDEYHI